VYGRAAGCRSAVTDRTRHVDAVARATSTSPRRRLSEPGSSPVIRATFNIQEQELRRGNYTNNQVVEWLKEAGATETWVTSPPAPIAVNSHAYGGARMGNDPHTSVVDKWLVSHEVPNLVVLGGATFPTSTGYNPTNTIEALAWRTGDHLATDWKTYAA
jgi:gluconate 2-dehydrogenase alpha chain